MEARTSMTARQIGRANPTSQARLQLILILLAAWNLSSFFLLLFNTSLSHVETVDGVLGARVFSGATAVLAIAYLYAARNPVRHRFVLWLAAVEQVVALFSYAFHWARGDFNIGEMALPVTAAAVLLALLIANMPRQTDTF